MGNSGITFEELEATGYHMLPADPVPRDRPFATPTGKIELYSTVLAELGQDPLPGFTPAVRATRGLKRRVRRFR